MKPILLFVIAFVCLTTSLFAQKLDVYTDDRWTLASRTPGADGTVFASTVFQGEWYVGGSFFNVAGAPTTRGIARWNGTEWRDVGYSVNNAVNALAEFGGKLYVGGTFTTAGGYDYARLATWDGNEWGGVPGVLSGEVRALHVFDGHLYVGGLFTLDGVAGTVHLARFDGIAWSVMGDELDNTVTAIIDFEGDLIAAGGFLGSGSVTGLNGIARWNGSSWSGLGSGVALLGNGQVPSILAVAVFKDTLYVGGPFSQIGGAAGTSGSARWKNGAWMGLGGPGLIQAYSVEGDTLFAGGIIHTSGGSTAMQVGRYDGQAWTVVGTIGSGVRTVGMYQNRIHAGGSFSHIGNQPVNRIAVWNGSGWDRLGGDGLSNQVWALTTFQGAVIAGGLFQLPADPLNIRGLGRFDGTTWTSIVSGLNGGVYALATDQTRLVAGGDFIIPVTSGPTARNFGIWDGTQWTGTGAFNGTVYALALTPNGIYAGGSFTEAPGSVPATNLAYWNGTNWSAVGGGTNGRIYSMAYGNGQLYVGGQFTNASGVPGTLNLARWDGTAWHAMGSGSPASVRSMKLIGNDLFLHRNLDVAVWDGAGFITLGSGSSRFQGFVFALAEHRGRIIAGGQNSVFSGLLSGVSIWEDEEWTPLGSGTTNGTIYAMTVLGDDLYIGGNLFNAGSGPAAYFSRYNLSGTTTTSVESNERIPGFILEPNYPNPFNPSTRIAWSQDRTTSVRVVVTDILGREVAVLQEGMRSAGRHTLDFDASRLASGMYLIRLTGDGVSLSRKITLFK